MGQSWETEITIEPIQTEQMAIYDQAIPPKKADIKRFHCTY